MWVVRGRGEAARVWRWREGRGVGQEECSSSWLDWQQRPPTLKAGYLMPACLPGPLTEDTTRAVSNRPVGVSITGTSWSAGGGLRAVTTASVSLCVMVMVVVVVAVVVVQVGEGGWQGRGGEDSSRGEQCLQLAQPAARLASAGRQGSRAGRWLQAGGAAGMASSWQQAGQEGSGGGRLDVNATTTTAGRAGRAAGTLT